MTVDEPQKKPELEGFQKNMRVYNAKRKFKAGVMALGCDFGHAARRRGDEGRQ